MARSRRFGRELGGARVPSPDQTRGRNRYLQPIQLIVAGVAGLGTLVYPLIVPYPLPDEPIATLIIGLVSAACLAGGVVLLWDRYRGAPVVIPGEIYKNAIITASPAQARHLFHFRSWVFVIAWTFWSALVGYELTRLQLGWAETSRTVWPIPVIYQSLGYWPAVLFFPALGLPVFLVLESRLRRQLRAIKEGRPDGSGPSTPSS